MSVPRIITLEEVAEYLRGSVKTVRRLIAAGKLQAFKSGGRVFVLEAELENYIKRQVERTLAR